MSEFAVQVKGVYKDFELPHERVGTLKGWFTGIIGGSVRNSKTTQHALKDISFSINKGEFFGIVGRNGSGKSTLLKIIAGIYQPTRGSLEVSGKLVPFIELGVGFNPELTGRENVYLNGAILGFSRKEIDGNYGDIVQFAELEDFMDQKLKNYSSGMQVRLAFACATRANAEILLVDEVLAVGDADFQRKCFNYFRQLKKEKKTVIFVTHDMSAVREYCDRAMLIDESRIKDAGKSEKIAQEYSRLFVDKTDDKDDDATEKKRWGNGDAKFLSTTAELKADKVYIRSNIKVSKQIEKLVYGIHIFSSDGSELTAMNNRMISSPDIVDAKPGEDIELSWEILNIFNDGKYFVTLTLVDSNGVVFDWSSEATTFTVKRLERSTTSIVPPVTVHSKKVKRTNP